MISSTAQLTWHWNKIEINFNSFALPTRFLFVPTRCCNVLSSHSLSMESNSADFMTPHPSFIFDILIFSWTTLELILDYRFFDPVRDHFTCTATEEQSKVHGASKSIKISHDVITHCLETKRHNLLLCNSSFGLQMLKEAMHSKQFSRTNLDSWPSIAPFLSMKPTF